jgi:hypothetical protein
MHIQRSLVYYLVNVFKLIKLIYGVACYVGQWIALAQLGVTIVAF